MFLPPSADRRSPVGHLSPLYDHGKPGTDRAAPGLLLPSCFQYVLRALLGEHAHEPLHARALAKAKQLPFVNLNDEFLGNREVPRELAEAIQLSSLLLAILIKHDNSMHTARSGHLDAGQNTGGAGRKWIISSSFASTFPVFHQLKMRRGSCRKRDQCHARCRTGVGPTQRIEENNKAPFIIYKCPSAHPSWPGFGAIL